MLEKPAIKDERIIACLQDTYGLHVEGIAFLPIGADQNTAVYRALGNDKRQYFVKLRKGVPDRAAILVPAHLHTLGMKQIIPTIPTRTGQLWADIAPYNMLVYPFIEGRDGYERKMSPEHWAAFGAALKRFHTAVFPPSITDGVRREGFSPRWQESVRSHYTLIDQKRFDDPVAVKMAAFLKTRRDETLRLVESAERLALDLQAQPPDFILCHGDIHGWNLLIDDDEALYIVDWDTLVFAPKERDLMFIGGGIGRSSYSPGEEKAMFYRGYGRTDINQTAIAYYRYERIIEDIAIFCDQIFLSDEGSLDREQALEHVKSNYLPNSTIEVAQASDQAVIDG